MQHLHELTDGGRVEIQKVELTKGRPDIRSTRNKVDLILRGDIRATQYTKRT